MTPLFVSAAAFTLAVFTNNEEPSSSEIQASFESSANDGLVQQDGTSVIVTGSRLEESRFQYPGSSLRLDEELLLKEQMVRSLPAALEEEIGVSVQKTAYGQGSPFIRGWTAYHTVALVDGIRLNNSVFRSGPNQYWTTIDPLALERLEVIRGTSSVLYGSDAVGGVAQGIYRERQSFEEGFHIGGMLHLRYSSANQGYVSRLQLEGNVGKSLGFVLGMTRGAYGDLDAGRHTGNLPNTGYRDIHGDGKITYKLSDSARLVVAHQNSQVIDVPRTHRTIFGRSFRGSTIGTELQRDLDQDRQLTYARLFMEDGENVFDKARFTVSYHVQSEERDRVRSDGRRDNQGFTVRTWGVDLQAEKDTDVGLFVYGAEYYRDDVTSFRRDFNADGSLRDVRIQGPVGDEGSYDLLGVFVQDRIPLGEKFELTPGLRYSYISAGADRVEDPQTGDVIDIDDSWSSIIGDLRFSWFPTDVTHTYVSVAQGFRAPNLSDLSRLDSARSNEIETPSPGLDPEKFVTVELGAKVDEKDWGVEAAYFHTWFDDLIITQPTGAVIEGDFEVTKRNASNGINHGIEIGGYYKPSPPLTCFADFIYTAGRVKSFPTSDPVAEREPLSRRPPIKGHLGVRYEPPESNWYLEGVFTVADEQDQLSARDEGDTQRIPPGGTPAYSVWTARGGVEAYKDVWLTLAIENITNRDYRVHGSGVNEPGTNVIAGLTVRF